MIALSLRQLSTLFTLTIVCVCVIKCQVTQPSYSSLEDADSELHANQIPPPGHQPTEDEVKKGMEELIDASVDKNNDGKVSTEELREWLEAVHHQIISDSVERQWEYYQPTMQEVHSWEGYAPEMKEVLHFEQFKKLTYPDDYLAEAGEAGEVLVKRSEKRWALADENNDTVLTKEEFQDLIHPEESQRVQHILVDEAIEDMDKDGDGQVSYPEYINHLESVTDEAEKSEGNWKQVHENHFKEYLDKNRDGQLNREELKEWLIPSYNKHDAEAYRLLTIADEDKDGELSKSEITSQFHHFYSLLPPSFWNQFPSDPMASDSTHDEL